MRPPVQPLGPILPAPAQPQVPLDPGIPPGLGKSRRPHFEVSKMRALEIPEIASEFFASVCISQSHIKKFGPPGTAGNYQKGAGLFHCWASVIFSCDSFTMGETCAGFKRRHQSLFLGRRIKVGGGETEVQLRRRRRPIQHVSNSAEF